MLNTGQITEEDKEIISLFHKLLNVEYSSSKSSIRSVSFHLLNCFLKKPSAN